MDEGTIPVVVRVKVSDAVLLVDFRDGRTITAPLDWFPRLVHGSRSERNAWRLIGGGSGIRWESLDEDISVEGLLAGRRSGESPTSIKRWLAGRSGAAIRRRRVESDARKPAARSRPSRKTRRGRQEARR